MTTEIINTLSSILETNPTSISFKSVGGGSINQCYKIDTEKKSFFCKLNQSENFPDLFVKEKSGLDTLALQRVIRVPLVKSVFSYNGTQVLLMEWIEQGKKTDSFWNLFGEQLARLHHVTSIKYGFDEDNYMGALPQSNNYADEWIDFFVRHRLMPQIKIAVDNRLLNSDHVTHFERLFKQLPQLLSPEPASLLHGDLWSGNFLCDDRGYPVLVDPAV